MERYEIIKNIDEGAFGIVHMAQNRETGEICAIKRIKRKVKSWEECINMREIKALSKLKHPNIIKLREVFKAGQELFLVFEYCEKNLLKMYLDDYKTKGLPMPEPVIRELIIQIVTGLSYMHKNGFFHRDLKPENLLINAQKVLKIADFGLAREIRSSPPFTDYVATRWYRAPEILLKSVTYNSPVDIFALGCIMAEFYRGQPLFNGNSEIDQLNKICSVIGTPPRSWNEGHRLAGIMGYTFPNYEPVPLGSILKSASPAAIDLLKAMLSFDSSKRPSALKILSHPFFAEQGRGLSIERHAFCRDALYGVSQDKIDKVNLYQSSSDFKRLPKPKPSQRNLDPKSISPPPHREAKVSQFDDHLCSSTKKLVANAGRVFNEACAPSEGQSNRKPNKGSRFADRLEELLDDDRLLLATDKFQSSTHKREAQELQKDNTPPNQMGGYASSLKMTSVPQHYIFGPGYLSGIPEALPTKTKPFAV